MYSENLGTSWAIVAQNVHPTGASSSQYENSDFVWLVIIIKVHLLYKWIIFVLGVSLV